jgi:hypothetical protein
MLAYTSQFGLLSTILPSRETGSPPLSTCGKAGLRRTQLRRDITFGFPGCSMARVRADARNRVWCSVLGQILNLAAY